MSSLSLLAVLWFAADPAASRVDVSGGAAVEVRGGWAPRGPRESAEPAVLAILTPDVDMEVASRRGALFNLGYTPRVQHRYRNLLNVKHPLLLHQVYATLRQSLDPRWVLGVNLGGSVGEVGYNAAPEIVGDGADDPNVSQPDVSVLQIAVASAGLSAEGRLTRRHTLGLRTNVVYRTPLGIPEVTDENTQLSSTGIPEQLSVEGAVSLDTRVSQVDAVEVEVTPGYFDYNAGDTQFVTAQAVGQWRREIRPSLQSTVGAGVFAAAGIGDTQTNDVPILPVVLASVTGGLVRSASHSVDATLSAGLTPYFDRVRVDLSPRATLNGSIQLSLPPRWTVRGLVGAVTNATRDPRTPREDGDGSTPITESQFRVATPVTYQISEDQQFEFGLLMTARAPHLASDDLSFGQSEAWFYVAYRIGAGTARGGQEVGGGGQGAVSRSARGNSDAARGGRR
ncbi:MAG: hypothetical protein KUG77_11210 [Nannocystaceae bacterium]|nr:hypothetical protein [Nannocystaceae bacterium]